MGLRRCEWSCVGVIVRVVLRRCVGVRVSAFSAVCVSGSTGRLVPSGRLAVVACADVWPSVPSASVFNGCFQYVPLPSDLQYNEDCNEACVKTGPIITYARADHRSECTNQDVDDLGKSL